MNGPFIWQQMHPLFNLMISFREGEDAVAVAVAVAGGAVDVGVAVAICSVLFTIFPSMSISPYSFTITPNLTRAAVEEDNKLFKMVVFPAPKKPVNNVMGNRRSLGMAAIFFLATSHSLVLLANAAGCVAPVLPP